MPKTNELSSPPQDAPARKQNRYAAVWSGSSAGVARSHHLWQIHSRWRNVQSSSRRACRIASHERQTNNSNGCHAKADILVRAPMTGCGVKTAPEVSSHFSLAPGGNVYPSECGGAKVREQIFRSHGPMSPGHSLLPAPCLSPEHARNKLRRHIWAWVRR